MGTPWLAQIQIRPGRAETDSLARRELGIVLLIWRVERGQNLSAVHCMYCTALHCTVLHLRLCLLLRRLVVVPKSNVGTENRRGCRERKGKGKRKEKERARKRIAWERGGVGGCVDGRPGLMLFPIYYHWFRSDQTRPDQVQAGSGA
jgi:hypothetical protein